MKLLLDENLPPALATALHPVYAGSTHVHQCGLGSADDLAIWSFAREQGFVIVTKDADYEVLSLLKGSPPKVIWLRTGNCTTEVLVELFQLRAREIALFLASDSDAVLEIRPA
jgi:predicted nuclease of predicted toxin-antitoxin system